MKSLAEPRTPAPQDTGFVLHFEQPADRRPIARAAIASITAHVLGLLFLLTVRFEATPPRQLRYPEIEARQVTPLVAPVFKQPTQKAPNTKEVAKEINIQGLLARKEFKSPPPVPAASPQPRAGVPAPAALPDAPRIAPTAPQTAQLPPPGTGMTNQPPPPPQIETSEKPKITLENVPGSGHGAGNANGGQSSPKFAIPAPKNTVSEAVARVSKRPGGGLVVGDDADQPPSIGEALSQHAAPGKMGSSLELLSDPQGADFRPYLIKVLAAVRRNWFAVIPESARLGRQGKVLIQFAISRNGSVPKLVIAVPSGADPLDRAAVAGISASNPFPPLPPDFQGDQIRLQLSFVYNGRR